MKKTLIVLTILVCLVLGRDYPMYRQCDPKWQYVLMGTSQRTICQKGCLISSVSMVLKALGKQYDPASFNKWLTQNNGYANGIDFVWGSVKTFGLIYGGNISNNQIKQQLDKDNVVILSVRNGSHWVLATGYSGDNIKVNDPGYSVTSYSLSQIKDGNSRKYTIK